mgnify:CR=1 FL=1
MKPLADGSRAAEGSYVAGQCEGLWTYWAEDGSELTRREFAAGRGAKK